MDSQPERPILLVTRPAVAAEGFVEAFRNRFGQDWPVIVSPLTEIEPLDTPIPEFQTAIFTSQNAVAAFQRLAQGQGRRAYCVGQRTAQAAREAGFDAIAGPGDAEALSEMIAQRELGGKLLFLRGEQVAFDLENRLTSAGIETESAIIYRQVSRPLSGEAQAALRASRPVLVPIFSPNAADRFLNSMPDAPKPPLFVAAMSEAVASRLKSASLCHLEVASHPDAQGMLDALAVLLQRQKAG
ncbi:uroporphyrinogen-III synthase [Thioclava sp.]|uniref:uroporphyrinogen-III synthase n=1 Tax=Thioclava sp. TaxID=1933450 RepID=UPI003242DF7D